MTEPKKELKRTTIQDEKVYFGEKEFTNLMRVLIRVYRYRSNNQSPTAIILPGIFEVDGVKIEFPTVEIVEK